MANKSFQWGKWSNRSCCTEHLDMLQQLIEIRLPYIRGGSSRVEKASQIIGQSLSLRDDAMFSLSLASRYADIGLIGISDKTLLSEETLSPEVKKAVDLHTDYGGRLISKVFPDLPEAMEGVWFHHERPDGQGPFGLIEKQIPLVAGVVSFTTALDAMANGRPHRPPMDPKAILNEIKKYNGQQFCSNIVFAFQKRQEELLEVIHVPQEKPSISVMAKSCQQCTKKGNNLCPACKKKHNTHHPKAG